MSIKGQGHSDLNVKTCFSQKQLGVWSQSSYESLRENGNEIYTNELGHITNMTAMPINGKNLKKSSPEPLDR